jgi:hypothetical protein
MITIIIALVIWTAVVAAAGWYGHYKFGAKVAADVAKIRSVV